MIWINDGEVFGRHPGDMMKQLEARLAVGAPFLAGALIAAEIGWLEMTRADRLGAICGLHDGAGHCAACYAAAILGLTGLAMIVRRPQSPAGKGELSQASR